MLTRASGFRFLACLAFVLLTPGAMQAQISTQAVAFGECDETCVETVDEEGNTNGGACISYGQGEGDGDGCFGTLAKGCSLQVTCSPPAAVGELKALDGSSATACLNVVPELTTEEEARAASRGSQDRPSNSASA